MGDRSYEVCTTAHSLQAVVQRVGYTQSETIVQLGHCSQEGNCRTILHILTTITSHINTYSFCPKAIF